MKYVLNIFLVSLFFSCTSVREKEINPRETTSAAEIELEKDLAALNLVHGQIKSTLSEYMSAVLGATSGLEADEGRLLQIAKKAQSRILKLTRLQTMKTDELRASASEFISFMEHHLTLDNNLDTAQVERYQLVRESIADHYQNALMVKRILPEVLEIVFSNEALEDFYSEGATREIANSSMAQIEQEMDVFFLLIEATREKNLTVQKMLDEVII